MACRCLNDIYIPIVSFNLLLILFWDSDEKNNTAESWFFLGE